MGAVRSVEESVRRVPPHNPEAEEWVLGGVLIDPSAMHLVADMITTEDFYREAHRMLYAAMLEVHERKEPIDPVVIAEVMRERGTLLKSGGASYLAELADRIPSAANIGTWAKIVRDLAVRRRAITAALEIATEGYEPTPEQPAGAYLEAARERFALLADTHLPVEAKSMAEVGDAALARLRARDANSYSTGITSLDYHLGGLVPGITCLAGQTGTGKTAIAMRVAYSLARQGIGVVYRSNEMDAEEMYCRLWADELSVANQLVSRGILNPAQYERAAEIKRRWDALPIHFWDDDTPWPDDFRRLERFVRQHPEVKIVIYDNLQATVAAPSRWRVELRDLIGDICRRTNALARGRKLAVILVSQFNREPEKQKRPPMISDLAEASHIERFARLILFLHLENPDANGEEVERLWVMAPKVRNGPRGLNIPFGYHGKFCRLIDPRDDFQPEDD